MKTRIDLPQMLCRSAMLSLYVPKQTHAVFKSNISSDKDYIKTSFVMFFFLKL